MIYLDTHVLIWLYLGDLDLFSEKAKKTLEKEDLLISPIVSLELQYLLEIKRILVGPEKIIKTLSGELGIKECEQNFKKIISKSIRINWTRDPFDRIIVSQASIKNTKLLTKDKSIISNYKNAFWS